MILLTVQEMERTGEWSLPLSYFAFWTVRLGGWLPRFDRCANCGKPFGAHPAYFGELGAGIALRRVPALRDVRDASSRRETLPNDSPASGWIALSSPRS